MPRKENLLLPSSGAKRRDFFQLNNRRKESDINLECESELEVRMAKISYVSSYNGRMLIIVLL
jgi:hypothetical protein